MILILIRMAVKDCNATVDTSYSPSWPAKIRIADVTHIFDLCNSEPKHFFVFIYMRDKDAYKCMDT